MRLKSFSTYGFKSFADKTELSFDKGITAVVGPNGSGKSNISDAIRWVLGEQSAKYLRGSKMEDIIFSGSSKRRALGVAEVTVEFDNSDGTLPLEFEQVSISRRIFRSGDSEYAINKKSCRLKDIIDLMADTGLGKGSMSIIGQNKIDEILNSRAEDRRSLFEEAAGIAKYRLRKKDAVKRLDDTADNLIRINDIRSEVDAQVEPLAKAAEKTHQYNKLTEDLRLCRLSVLLHKLDAMKAEDKALQEKKNSVADEYARQAAVLSTHQAEAADLQRQLDRITDKYSQLLEEIKLKETNLEKLRGRQGVLDERINQSKKATIRLEERNIKTEQQIQEQEEKMQELAVEYDLIEKKRKAAFLQVECLKREREEASRQLEQIKQDNTSAQSEFFSGMQQLLKMRNDLRTLEQEQEQRVRRRELLKKSIDEAEETVARAEEKYNLFLEQQARCTHEMELLQKNGIDVRAAYEEIKKQIQLIVANQQQCQRQLTTAETKEESLKRLQKSYEGFGYGIKNVMQSVEPWRKNIIGVAAELIRAEDKFVTAIETALGEGAQNIVSHDAATAKAAIAYLKRLGGRATFLPLDTVQSRIPNKEEAALTKLPGILGYAFDLISYKPEAEKAIRFLLGRVLVAENIDAALYAAKEARYRLRIVTLDGDVVNSGGSMSGGSRKHKEGYLSRSVEIIQIAEHVKNLRKQMLEFQEELEIKEAIANKQKQQLEQLTEQYQQRKLKIEEIKFSFERLEKEKADDNDHLALLLDERSAVTAAYMENRTKVKEMRSTVAEYEIADKETKALLDNLQKQLAKVGSTLTALDNQLQDAKILLENSNTRIQYISENIKNLDKDTLRLRDDISSVQNELIRLKQSVIECNEQKQQMEQQSMEIMVQLQQILSGKDSFVEQRSILSEKQGKLEKLLPILQKQVSESEALLRQAELELVRHNTSCEHVHEQLQQEYQLDESKARALDLGELQQMQLSQLQKQETSLTLTIAALGPINAAAVEEYNAVKERSEFLRKQYEDLCDAKANLEAVISEINYGMTKRFKDAFAKINEYFAKCYAKLFGGGTAVLRLTAPDNLLDSGIDIEVQPPGKKLQSLYLMSGGERALTVIALLFALLSYQPSPFCVLDEIDAPLDDANIQRFADFLRDYARDTQFIIITHRKGTMEAADIMYGVTMEESGVSKLLSVKINAKENE